MALQVTPFGLSPTYEQAFTTFNCLGKKDRWKQIVDGLCHKWGPRVFDEGLHVEIGGKAEWGFYDSMEKGLDFATSHLKKPWDIELYRKLHGILCQHFRGEYNNTLFYGMGAGEIRSSFHRTQFCSVVVRKITRHFDPKLKNLSFDAARVREIELWEVSFAPEYIDMMFREMQCDNQDLKVDNQLGLHLKGFELDLSYGDMKEEEREHCVRVYFADYEKQMKNLNDSPLDRLEIIKKKTRLIAQLFQRLEWLHPFMDGQGRLDLVQMCKMLCEEGLNPAILEDPYMSTYMTLEDWTYQLIKGMRLWQKEAGLNTADLDRILAELEPQIDAKYKIFMDKFRKGKHGL